MPEKRRWVDELEDEDLAFLRRFLLASGSLKALAEDYGVSYPTIRIRLDRLIAKVQVLEQYARVTPFERKLRALYADGKLDMPTLKALLAAHEEETEARDDTP